ncbi:MAG: tetratricopeptide repeat protein [Phycisphaerales bacterium]|nr:tetratricopeptide repeat protein [Planctomycetota bacterium]MCH8508548.1 tetratricopeptide repeat protein [Phycisphaerales bacterium]
MPDETEQNDAPETEAPAPAPADPVERVRSGWRELWQVPVLLAASGVLLLGVAFAVATAPDPEFGPVLTRAEQLIEREQYEDAIDLLNSRVHPWTNRDVLTVPDRQRYHLAKARSIYWGQKKLEINDDRNHVSIIREYMEAERQGLELPARDVAALADTYLSRGELNAALIRLATIPSSANAVREPVIRRAVALLLRPPSPDRNRALEVLADVLADPTVSIDQRVWAVEAQSRIRLDQGYVDETITRLLREIPRLDQAGPAGRARLHLLLARAYGMIGADRAAMDQVNLAESLSAAGDGHYPMVLLERGRLEQRAGNAAAARDTYAGITARYAHSEAYPWAMIGLGETEALLGSPELSLEAYDKLIDEYDALGILGEPTRERIMLSLLDRAGEALVIAEPRLALRYTTLGERIMRGRPLPAPLLETIAMAHRRSAEELSKGSTTRANPLVGLDPSIRVEVQRHLIAAAINRRFHAESFVLTDIRRYADSLWEAADLFDRAGDQREAVQAFKTYAESLPGDARAAEARFRMAEALRAMGEYQAAAEAYQDLIESRHGTGGQDIGVWADASYVPLAQTYLYDENPDNNAEAERLLRRVLDGSMTGTTTRMFRDALVELAFLYDRSGRSARAIERLEEVLRRYPGDAEEGLIRYRLGEAHRRLAEDIRQSLEDSLPPTTRSQRADLLANHREEAIRQYERSIAILGMKREADRSRLEEISLRNAHFYLGDLLSDLGRYDDAIRAYDLARDRYSRDPATLVALIQIVNIHVAQGDLRRARTANERARRFYLSLPDSTWDDPALPMNRRDWQAWLDASSRLLAAGPSN